MMLTDQAHNDEGHTAPDAQKPGAGDLFPAEGTFSPVVPLSEVDESPRTSTSGPAAPAVSSDAAVSEVVPGAVEAVEQHEQEVATLVRPRVRPSPARPSSHIPHSGGAGRSRPFRAAAFALLIVTSLTAGALTGLLIGGYRKKPARTLNVERPAPPVEAGPQVVETRTGEQHAGPSVKAEPEPEPSTEILSATVVKALPEPMSPRVGSLTPQPSPAAVASEARRSSNTAQSPRRAASPPALVNAGEGRRAPSAPRGTEGTEGRTSAAPSSRENLPPVFSPPATDSAKKKVIPWP